MAELSSMERVYAAADTIGAERNPTVASVRELAGVSNADATRYLKQWREERQNAGSAIAAAPPALIEQAARLAGGLWSEASRLAAETHAALEREWVEARAHQERELGELVVDLDAANAAHAAEVARLTDEAGRFEAAADESREATEAAVAELSTTRDHYAQTLAQLQAELSEAHGTIAALQTTQAALIARIPAAPEK
ncbi:DNA-binding protein [Microbacteriaceae bacterium VKM Ac-2854]|nr:DNA-binding protein [Microbacteriaceae bacterium VKM Ac-2854]